MLPTIWRIERASLRVTRHDLVLDADHDLDVGFTGLAYAAKPGVYFAVAEAGTLWRIDPLLRRAQKIALDAPMARACGLASLPARKASRFFGLCVHTRGQSWTVHFSPDQRAAYRRQGCE